MIRAVRAAYDQLRRLWLARLQPAPRGFRYERFGGIAQTAWPRALVFVDRDRARALGHDAPPAGLWPVEDDAEPAAADEAALHGRLLTAPIEAHLQLTNRCAAGCRGCYTGATPEGAPREWDLPAWRAALTELAAAGVFHVALGGGESAVLPWLGELCEHARALGIVPNLTTSGVYDDATLARLCGWAARGLLGQINVSIDGIGPGYAAVRGFDGFAQADRALVALRRVLPDVGINCVVTRETFPQLRELFAYARRRRCSEIELLRFKPSGRGARRETYQALRCTDAQHAELLPTVLALSREHRVRVRLDCSFTPMIAHHKPPPALFRWLAIYGCAGGDLLVAARAGGSLSACSFAPPVEAKVTALRDYFARPAAFAPFRAWLPDAETGAPAVAEPCRSCEYHALCRGGCRVVTQHVAGDGRQPDPECPRVLAHKRATGADGAEPESPARAVPGARRRLPVLG